MSKDLPNPLGSTDVKTKRNPQQAQSVPASAADWEQGISQEEATARRSTTQDAEMRPAEALRDEPQDVREQQLGAAATVATSIQPPAKQLRLILLCSGKPVGAPMPDEAAQHMQEEQPDGAEAEAGGYETGSEVGFPQRPCRLAEIEPSHRLRMQQPPKPPPLGRPAAAEAPQAQGSDEVDGAVPRAIPAKVWKEFDNADLEEIVRQPVRTVRELPTATASLMLLITA